MARAWVRLGAFGLALVLSTALPLTSFAAEKDKNANRSTPAQTQTQSKTQTPPPAAEQTAEDDEVSQEDIDALLQKADQLYDSEQYEDAFNLYLLVSLAEDPYALCMVGLMYETGKGTKEDLKQAVEYYQQSAELGFGAAMYNMGLLYENGKGVKKDLLEAAGWYRKGADAGHVRSMYYLGDMYLNGLGVDKDVEEAVTWLTKAADGGQPDASWSLSLRYVYGEGVSKDTFKAADYAYFALTHGVEAAKDNLRDARNKDVSKNFLKRIQQLLNDDGFYDGSIDGNFGPATRDAIDDAYNSEG